MGLINPVFLRGQSINILESLIALLIFVSIKSAAQPNSPLIPIPNCTNQCGNMSIPYPFGLITENSCYLNEFFTITCQKTQNQTKAFLNNGTIEISDILPDGQLRVLHYLARDSYAPNGTNVHWNNPSIKLPARHYTINNTANKFTIVGCDSYGYISGADQLMKRNYSTGCTATCNAVDDLMDGSCSGIGCCQSAIPKEVTHAELELYSYDNFTYVRDFNNVSYAFIVEESKFRFSPANLTNLKDVRKLPMIVDWVVGSESCVEARKNFTRYACKSNNSRCYEVDPDSGSAGYRCSCEKGYQGNPYLTNGCEDIDECKNPSLNNCQEMCENKQGSYECSCPKWYDGDGKNDGQGCYRDKSFIFKLVAGIALGVIALIIAACWTYFVLRRRRLIRMKQTFFFQNGGMLLQEKLTKRERSSPDKAKIFTSFELKKATRNFHDSMIIGRGGYGTVYKGILQNNKIVAIKKSKQVDPTQINPNLIEQFINEVIILSQINHRNVVRLLGCCLETQVPLLVYDFIDNGTLNENIHNKAKARFLDWDKRLKIAADTAGVLSYLHSAASTPIIHRDIKSANILLDRNFTARVSDFGASRLVPMDKTQLSTMVQGTFGYLDPQYMQTNQLTEKSDVYSFGVVLLELLTGRKALSYDRPEEEMNLANYFLYIMRKERLIEILEESIVCEENMEQLMEVALLAKRCLNVRGEDRPNMREVAMELDGLRLGNDSMAPIEDDVQEGESLYSEELSSIAVSNDYGDSIRV